LRPKDVETIEGAKNMRTAISLATLAALVVPQASVHGLVPPTSSDGPIKLLSCVVSPQGILEAEVDNQGDDAMNCNIRCNYELGDRMFSHPFSVRIPARFHGRIGRFDTSGAKAGSYSGDLGSCEKSPRD
jgi:hypothetical protein